VRRRITLTMLAVVVGALVLTVAGGLLLIHRAAYSSAESDLTKEAGALAELLTTRAAITTDNRVLALLRNVGGYDSLLVAGLSSGGRFSSLPGGIPGGALDVGALENDQAVSGNVGRTVFVAEPVSLTARQRAALGPVPVGDLPVLLVTRQVHTVANGVGYFLAVAAGVLAIGALVGMAVARRITAPLQRAVATTEQMAAGDLQARVASRPGDDPELRHLADAINALGDGLARSRGLERQFLLSVSHDLRTPLTSIRGYAEAVSEGAAEDVPAAAGVIAGEARRLERLVQDLLDLARLDARQFSLQLEPVDAGAVATGALEAFRPEAESFGVTLRSDIPAGSASWVRADPDRLSQIVANLVENGIKFTTSSVGLSVEHVDGWCRIAVADDGPGIPPGSLARVFERHFTAERSGGRRVGTGLGLAIVAELARAMGGSVQAQSPWADGRGTRMVLHLPLAAPPPEQISN
jgi:two-component system sensor histidine kinase BaeS